MSMERDPILLTRNQAADFLGVKPQTLAAWRVEKRYDLPLVKVGRLCKYRKADLLAWLEQRTVGGDTGKNKRRLRNDYANRN